jgi:hypothetical protein
MMGKMFCDVTPMFPFVIIFVVLKVLKVLKVLRCIYKKFAKVARLTIWQNIEYLETIVEFYLLISKKYSTFAAEK